MGWSPLTAGSVDVPLKQPETHRCKRGNACFFACDLASRWNTAPIDFIFSEQRLSAHYFGRAMVDGHHDNNYWIFQHFPSHPPHILSNCKVMKVRFSRGDQITLRKNNKRKKFETKNKTNELKVEFFAVILVPFRASNSQ